MTKEIVPFNQTDSNGPLPWGRQSGESNKNYATFRRYLLMGPQRNISELWRLENKGDSELGYNGVASKWKWKERAERYDIAQADKSITKTEQRRAKILELNLETSEYIAQLQRDILHENDEEKRKALMEKLRTFSLVNKTKLDESNRHWHKLHHGDKHQVDSKEEKTITIDFDYTRD